MTSRTDSTPSARPASRTTRWRIRRSLISVAATVTSQFGEAVTTGAVMWSPTQRFLYVTHLACGMHHVTLGQDADHLVALLHHHRPDAVLRHDLPAPRSDSSGPTNTTGLFIRLRTSMAKPPRQVGRGRYAQRKRRAYFIVLALACGGWAPAEQRR